MHHCLQIYEVLELIFEAVQVPNRRYYHQTIPDKPSLLALLQTCRYFTVPAAKLLWRDISTLAPLLFTLPGDLLEVEEFEHADSVSQTRIITFRRDPLPSDWGRFDFYAQFVRELGIIELGRKEPYPDPVLLREKVYFELWDRKKVLLPKLRKFAGSSRQPLLLLRLIHNAHTLHLNMHPSDDLHLQLDRLTLHVSIQATSRLKSLHLLKDTSWQITDQDSLLPLLSNLLELLDLDEFKCDWLHLTDQMMETLIRMPSLRKLNIYKNIPALARILRLFPTEGPRLREMSVKTDIVGQSHLAQILISLQPCLLEVFSIHPSLQEVFSVQFQTSIQLPETIEFCNQQQLNDLLSAVVNHCSPRFLTKFVFGGWGLPRLAPSAIVDYKLLCPLFAFSNLRRLCLDCYHFDLTDAEVKELAISWPLLEQIFIGESQVVAQGRFKPRTTIRCLLWFAIYCRNLEDLGFTFTGIDTFSEAELAMASNSPVTYMSVGHSTITNPDTVADFFVRVFPNVLAFLWVEQAMDDENAKIWKECDTRMDVLYKAIYEAR